MNASNSQQMTADQINEVIQNLELQILDISQRLSRIERVAKTSSNLENPYLEGDPTFLGTKYQKPKVELDAAENTYNGRFFGKDYSVSAAKVKIKSDGTERTFLGRKFSGQLLDQ